MYRIQLSGEMIMRSIKKWDCIINITTRALDVHQTKANKKRLPLNVKLYLSAGRPSQVLHSRYAFARRHFSEMTFAGVFKGTPQVRVMV